jgi:hypothetical protein
MEYVSENDIWSPSRPNIPFHTSDSACAATKNHQKIQTVLQPVESTVKVNIRINVGECGCMVNTFLATTSFCQSNDSVRNLFQTPVSERFHQVSTPRQQTHKGNLFLTDSVTR